jgi:septum formation protein
MRLILASASPRRADLLRSAGIDFDVIHADVDESVLPGETPEQHVRRLADAKARAVLARVGARPVLGADTVVVVDGQILGKPRDDGDARRMLRLLSGRQHVVMTGVCLLSRDGPGPAEAGYDGRSQGPADHLRQGYGGPPTPSAKAEAGHYVHMTVTMVEFAALTDAEIDGYVASGEPADKAGAYAVQGLASRFVTRIDGSYSNVVGLPVDVVYRLCKLAGLLIY